MKKLFSLFTNIRSNKKTIPNLVSGFTPTPSFVSLCSVLDIFFNKFKYIKKSFFNIFINGTTKTQHKTWCRGFTLLELLIVIGIIAILSVASVIVLNPAEAIKKSRDSQRISDLNTLKKAIGIYQVSTPNSKLAGADNTGCKGTTFGSTWQLGTDYIYYSYPSDIPGAPITGKNLDGVTFTTGGASQVSKENLGKVDGTGWLPIDFTSLPGGSPISSLPVDPINIIADPANPKSTDLVYRYVCSEQNLTYEMGATLESEAYTVTDNKMAKDGGNNNSYYEAGTGLSLINEESPLVASCGSYTVIGPDTLTYGTVLAEDGNCWLDRNLGATRVATAYNDTQSYGYLYQWGREVDGHQITTSGTTATLSSGDSPGHANYITSGASPYDWRNPQSPNASTLWAGANGGSNNVCPAGFHVPTSAEWQTWVTSLGGFTTATCGGAFTCRTVAFNSSLKIPTSGSRNALTAALANQGSSGLYWSNTPGAFSSYYFYFVSSAVGTSNVNNRANGYSARCLKD